MHTSKGWVALGGSSKKESTREEVLNKARAERAARTLTKQQQKAATVIQAAWRSQVARDGLTTDLLQQWQSTYSAAAAQPDTLLPGPELSQAVRLALQATLPLGSSRSSRMVAAGQPFQLIHSCIKGTIALVLRSLSSGQGPDRYTAAASDADPQVRLSWLVQSVQLCQLCCLTIAANSLSDVVLDAAAARLLELLASPTAWGLPAASTSNHSTTGNQGSCNGSQANAAPGICSAEQTPAALGVAAALLDSLKAQPMPLLLAARRCVHLRLSQQQLQQQQQQQQQSPSSGASMTATAVQRLMGVVLTLLESPAQREGRQHAAAPGQQSQFVACVVQLLLTAPGLESSLPTATKVRLLEPSIMCGQLLPAVGQLCSSGALAAQPAAHCLANLAQLLTGCAPGSNQQQQQQAHSRSLGDGQVAAAYVDAAVQLLLAARRPASAPSGRQRAPRTPQVSIPVSDVLLDECWMLGTQQHLLPLLQTLQQHSQHGMVLWAGYCCHLLQDAPKKAGSGSQGLSSNVLNVLAFAPRVLPSLWDWLARTAGLPLEAPLQASRGLDIAAVSRGPEDLAPAVALVMGLFCRSLAQLLVVLDDGDLHQRQTPFSLGASRAIASTLNSLVFHTAFPETAGQQQPGQHLKQQPAAELSAQVAPATLAHGMGLLREYAPSCLKSYYDKDSRKPFCQPQLWTEPYNNLMARLAAQQQQDGGALATTVAVVQALLVSTGLIGQDEEGSTAGAVRPPSRGNSSSGGPQQSPAAAAAATAARGAHLPGLRTNALLSLLKAAPQCVPFSVRLELFRQMIEQDKARGRWNLAPVEGGPRPVQATVRRDALLEDAFRALAGLGSNVKARLMVNFVNAQGLGEAGIDHGGLAKELLEQIVAAGTQPEYGLFATTEDTGLLYPNPTAEAIPQGLALLEFLGMMVGKALYEGILLNLSFAPFFIRCLQGGRPGLDDLSSLDAALHSNLLAVKTCPADQVEHLCLTFAAEQQLLGKTVQHNLLPDGDSVPVTASNRLLYVYLLADWHLNARLGRAASAFASGLSSVLPPSWLRLFSPSELNQLISGGLDTGVDVDDMAMYARYSNGYSESSHTVKLFWRAVRDMTPDQRCALLRFITSTSRAPLGGFKHLQPPLTIHKVDCGASPLALLGGKDVDRLPSASTCYNMLKLPNYKRQGTLKEKLLYAIGSGAGFELS